MFTMWLVAIGTTTLIEAVYWGHTKVVRLLIRKGASVNVETPSGRVPLLEACNRTNMHVAKVSAALTSPRAPARLTNACCHSSCFKGKQTLTRRMRSGEFCVCAARSLYRSPRQHCRSFTPLMIACRRGSLPLVQLLQKYGVDTRAVSKMRGTNAMHEARSYGRDEVLGHMLKVNCLGKVDAAIRQWEFGHIRAAFEKWVANSGVDEMRDERLNAST